MHSNLARRQFIFFVSIYFLALPLGAMNIGSIGSALKLVSFVPIGLALVNVRNISFKKPFVYYLMYVLFSACSILWSVNKQASIYRVNRYLNLALLLLSSCVFALSSDGILTIKKVLRWSSRLSGIVCLVFGSFIYGRLTLTGTIQEDPNYFCMYLSFGVIACIGDITSKILLRKKIFAAVELIIYFTIALLTGSRGGLVALILGALIYLICSGEKTFDTKKIIAICVMTVALYFGMTFLSDSMAERFTIASILESKGTHRFEIWEEAFDLYGRSNIFRKLFGYGIQGVTTAFANYGYRFAGYVMHNMFIETLLELGIFGLVSYCIMVFSFCLHAVKMEDKFAFGVIIMMVFMSMSTSISTFKPYFNIMMFVLMSMNQNYYEQNGVNDQIEIDDKPNSTM